MVRIKGIDVVLHQKVQTGINAFNEAVYTDSVVTVSNVLVSPTTADDLVDQNSLEGRRESYTLAIPKGDTHDWVNQTVEFWGKKWQTYGAPLQGIECDIPLDWNMKVTVERIE